MVRWQRGRSGESFTPLHSKIAFMFVADGGKTLDRHGNLCFSRNHHADVNDRFRRQPRNRRAAHLFNRRRNLTNGGPYPQAQLLEDNRPARIVVDDNDRFHVGLTVAFIWSLTTGPYRAGSTRST